MFVIRTVLACSLILAFACGLLLSSASAPKGTTRPAASAYKVVGGQYQTVTFDQYLCNFFESFGCYDFGYAPCAAYDKDATACPGATQYTFSSPPLSDFLWGACTYEPEHSCTATYQTFTCRVDYKCFYYDRSPYPSVCLPSGTSSFTGTSGLCK